MLLNALRGTLGTGRGPGRGVDGAGLPLPKQATEPFLELWEEEVFALLLAEAKIMDRLEAADCRL